MLTLKSAGRRDTVEAAKQFSQRLQPGDTVALFGGLGAGKTAFAEGVAAGLGYRGDVTSPTFSLVHEYLGGRLPLYHFDMYRVSGEEDLYSTGFYEYLDAGGVLLIEWSENIVELLPPDAIHVRISYGQQENERIIEIED